MRETLKSECTPIAVSCRYVCPSIQDAPIDLLLLWHLPPSQFFQYLLPSGFCFYQRLSRIALCFSVCCFRSQAINGDLLWAWWLNLIGVQLSGGARVLSNVMLRVIIWVRLRDTLSMNVFDITHRWLGNTGINKWRCRSTSACLVFVTSSNFHMPVRWLMVISFLPRALCFFPLRHKMTGG